MNKEIAVIAYEVEYGWPSTRRRCIPGYQLENGLVLVEGEKDEKGNYRAGAGMDGMYLQTGQSFKPGKKAGGKMLAFIECE